MGESIAELHSSSANGLVTGCRVRRARAELARNGEKSTALDYKLAQELSIVETEIVLRSRLPASSRKYGAKNDWKIIFMSVGLLG